MQVWFDLKREDKQNAGESVEKKEPSYTVSKNVTEAAPVENSVDVP